MLPLELLSPVELGLRIAERARARRLGLGLTQRGLAERAGVSLASLKRFERAGQIALVSLLRLALVLDATAEFGQLFPDPPAQSLDALLARPVRRRGRVS